MESKRKQQKNKINGWKWAFLILLSILLGTVIWVYSQLSPVVIGEPDLTPLDTSDEMTFQVATHKEDINQLVAVYLEEEVVQGNVDYQFKLDEEAELIGTFQLFGHDVQFSLMLEPFVMENGNLQFKASRLSIGNLNLPMTFAMNQIKNQLNTPDWVAINSEEETIVFNLNEFILESGMHFSVEKIDLAEDDIRVNVHIPAT